MFTFLVLTEKLLPKEKEFLSDLYVHQSKRMWYLAVSIIKNKEQAEDIVQSAFIKLIGHISTLQSFKDENKINGYIYVVTKNTALNMLKRSSKEIFVNNETLEYVKGLQDDTKTPETIFIIKTNLNQLKNEIKKLRPIYREAIYLRKILELEYKEIADICNITCVTARFRVSYALKKLKTFVEKGGNKYV